ncbi:MAG: 1-deoxy-D-xylulose-5-phosphate reductoisomerase [Clostridia bacterium]|nr:1-deoxy-D-xylulose-5-phosphate reductoisomerase [Clostridia bacterium]
MRSELTVLGSTGSIGRQTLEVARAQGFPVRALTANASLDLMEKQARAFHPELVALADPAVARELSLRLFGSGVKVLEGEEGVIQAARLDAPIVVSSIVGAAGILPTVEAIRRGARIALANKEVLVAAGSVVMPLVECCGAQLLPVDSEHSAIFQCLMARAGSPVRRILLTCSGGPFFGRSRVSLAGVTREQALAHPSWKMGAKITVDSATLMNKGFEVMEAAHLFGVALDQIEVLIHRQSVVHSMVEFEDRSVIAQLGTPDMKIPIQLALTWPQRLASDAPPLDFSSLASLTFSHPDRETFGCLALCERAFSQGGIAPAVLNAANEVAVGAFLKGKLPFLGIETLCRELLDESEHVEQPSLEDILEADRSARVRAAAHMEERDWSAL